MDSRPPTLPGRSQPSEEQIPLAEEMEGGAGQPVSAGSAAVLRACASYLGQPHWASVTLRLGEN